MHLKVKAINLSEFLLVDFGLL